MGFESIDEVVVDREVSTVYEHGWQSWSPTSTYRVGDTSARPEHRWQQVMRFRSDLPPPASGFQGEGLLVVDPGQGPVRMYAARPSREEVVSIRARLYDDRLVVRGNGPVDVTVVAEGLGAALTGYGDRLRARAAQVPVRPAPTVWCTWYQYFLDVTQQDVSENVRALDELDLPVDVVQVDDGWQAEVGDWSELSDRFSCLVSMVDQIRGSGRRAGIWLAPFIAAEHSALARRHPDWLAGEAGRNWGQRLFGLDLSHPGVREHLSAVFRSLRDIGFDYFKLDFLYGGALTAVRHEDLSPVAAYRSGLLLVRDAVGAQSYLLGCGAPMLPSVGLVDAMRVSPDTYDPTDPDTGSDPLRGRACIEARAWQHGRLWVNDADCLIARPGFARRRAWAELVERYGGLRSSSDRIRGLDDWGLETTRRLLADAPPPVPFAHLPDEYSR